MKTPKTPMLIKMWRSGRTKKTTFQKNMICVLLNAIKLEPFNVKSFSVFNGIEKNFEYLNLYLYLCSPALLVFRAALKARSSAQDDFKLSLFSDLVLSLIHI